MAVHDKLAKLQSDVNKIRIALDTRIDSIDAKVEKWGARVEELEKSHNDSMTRQELINLEMNSFKLQAQEELLDSRKCFDHLAAAVQELPRTIQIDSTQVHHSTRLVNFNKDEDDPEDDTCTTLDFIIAGQNERLNEHVVKMERIDEHVSDEIVRVMNWVTEKNQVEMDAMGEKINAIELDLNGKMSAFEVEAKVKSMISRKTIKRVRS